MALTVSDRERHAYVNGDAETLALIDQIELERDDDPPVPSDELKAHVEGWETNAWCLDRVVEALRTAPPLTEPAMRALATELQQLVDRLPRKGREEIEFKARVHGIFGLDEHLHLTGSTKPPKADRPRARPRPAATRAKASEQRP